MFKDIIIGITNFIKIFLTFFIIGGIDACVIKLMIKQYSNNLFIFGGVMLCLLVITFYIIFTMFASIYSFIKKQGDKNV
jgi:hypothetical protein